jgi:hypothetical protein
MKSNRSVNLAFEVEENKTNVESKSVDSTSGKFDVTRLAFNDGKVTWRGKAATSLVSATMCGFSILIYVTIQHRDLFLLSLSSVMLFGMAFLMQVIVDEAADVSFSHGLKCWLKRRNGPSSTPCENGSERIE